MLTIIGLIVWVLFTIALTIIPFVLIELSELDGGISYIEVLYCLFLLFLAAFNWPPFSRRFQFQLMEAK